MVEENRVEAIHTRIWQEEPEADNPYAAAICRCHGYDVYGDLLGKAGYVEYLYLLFRGEAPTPMQARLLDGLALALANPGPREASVHAAMAGGIGGSTAAACLTAALAVGAGGLGGAREVYRVMACFAAWGTDLEAWRAGLPGFAEAATVEVWPAPEHPPGFDPHGVSCPTPVRQVLAHLAGLGVGPNLPWLLTQRTALETCTGRPLALSAVAAAALADLGFDPDQGEMLTLLLRLPGAAAHALEQRGHGYREFPFFRLELLDDPGPAGAEGSGAAA
jgi:citrate synthase